MKIKDLIEYLKTLDQEKQLVVIGVDPTDWESGTVVSDKTIQLEEVYPTDENGLEGIIELPEDNEETGEFFDCVECYVVRFDC